MHIYKINATKTMKKRSERRKHCARAGCNKEVTVWEGESMFTGNLIERDVYGKCSV